MSFSLYLLGMVICTSAMLWLCMRVEEKPSALDIFGCATLNFCLSAAWPVFLGFAIAEVYASLVDKK